ncbi:MAG TPA: HAMP domain-containing sensor histidine kinase [Kofleriaceae bacterium]|nr:HAMP domain-containing sensor histidine kinase [Kofleriaceae bacterium]
MSEADDRDEHERGGREVEEIDRVREEFLRVAGHELRSPLTAMQLQIDTLIMAVQQSATTVGIEERAERIRRSLHKLGWIIEEVLDLVRAGGGWLPLRAAEVDVVDLARHAIERFAHDLERAGCEARLVGAGEALGVWDGPRVEHALGSLLIAAVKSGPATAIEIDIQIDEEGGARAEIRDGGAGLSPAQVALVFQPFDRMLAGLQAGNPILGLWLARMVAEAHGGRLVIAPGRHALHLPKTGRPP